MRNDADPLSGHDPSLTAGLRKVWREARQLELKARRALGGNGCFYEWLLLEALQEIYRETNDAVSQSQLVERTGLSKTVVSYWMASMNDRGTVDRQPALDGRAYRVYLSRDGQLTLLEYSKRLDAAGMTEARLFERFA